MHRTLLSSALAALLLAQSMPAMADAGIARLTVEAGAASVAPPAEPRRWGPTGGGCLAVSLSSQAWIELHGSLASFAGRKPPLRAKSAAATLLYDLDVLDVSPYIGLGVARNVIATPITSEASTVLTLVLGVNVVSFDWLLWGVVVRYYPLFDSDLLGSPAFATIRARIGTTWSLLD